MANAAPIFVGRAAVHVCTALFSCVIDPILIVTVLVVLAAWRDPSSVGPGHLAFLVLLHEYVKDHHEANVRYRLLPRHWFYQRLYRYIIRLRMRALHQAVYLTFSAFTQPHWTHLNFGHACVPADPGMGLYELVAAAILRCSPSGAEVLEFSSGLGGGLEYLRGRLKGFALVHGSDLCPRADSAWLCIDMLHIRPSPKLFDAIVCVENLHPFDAKIWFDNWDAYADPGACIFLIDHFSVEMYEDFQREFSRRDSYELLEVEDETHGARLGAAIQNLRGDSWLRSGSSIGGPTAALGKFRSYRYLLLVLRKRGPEVRDSPSIPPRACPEVVRPEGGPEDSPCTQEGCRLRHETERIPLVDA